MSFTTRLPMPARREFVRVGVVGSLGLTLGDFLGLREARADQKFYESKEGPAKSIIQVVLPGGSIRSRTW